MKRNFHYLTLAAGVLCLGAGTATAADLFQVDEVTPDHWAVAMAPGDDKGAEHQAGTQARSGK